MQAGVDDPRRRAPRRASRRAGGPGGLALALLLPLAAARAQEAPPLAAAAIVEGVVFDSLALRPLPGARVWTADGRHSVFADSLGRFVLDGVQAAGDAPLVVLAGHPAADSVGLGVLAGQVRLPAAGARVTLTLAVPSYVTLRQRACNGLTDAGDEEGGVLFGTVRTADGGGPVAGAIVAISWLEQGGRGGRSLDALVVRGLEATTDASGTYYACGLPTSLNLAVRAVTGGSPAAAEERRAARRSSVPTVMPAPDPLMIRSLPAPVAAGPLTSGEFSVHVGERRIRRRDVFVAGGTGATIVARVTGRDGAPLAGARVYVDDDPARLTDERGEVALPAAAGTRVVSVRQLGLAPRDAAVDVMAGDTAHVAFALTTVAAQLTAMRIEAARGAALRPLAEIAARRRDGRGHHVGMDELASTALLRNVLVEVPSMRVFGHGISELRFEARDRFGGWCAMRTFIDGRLTEPEELLLIRPNRLLALEIYTRPTDVPLRYASAIGRDDLCGAVLAWTRPVS